MFVFWDRSVFKSCSVEGLFRSSANKVWFPSSLRTIATQWLPWTKHGIAIACSPDMCGRKVFLVLFPMRCAKCLLVLFHPFSFNSGIN